MRTGRISDRVVPFVSVVIPTRNRAALLRDCVESLLAQDFPRNQYEIVVVDDGSIDQTASVVSAIQECQKSYALRYLHSKGGANVARNEGLRAAVGDPIVFVDDDVEAPPTWLRELVAGSMRHPGAGCLGGRIRLRLEGPAPRVCGREPLGETELDLGDRDQPAEAVWSANMAVRRSALAQVGLFREDLAPGGDEEEWEVRLRAAGGSVVYVADAWLWHRRTADSLRLWHLMKARFQRGRAQVAFIEAIGGVLTLRAQLSPIPRMLAHAVLRGCAWGLLATSVLAGRAVGLIQRRLSRAWRAAAVGQAVGAGRA